ncbi:PEP-CTERM sorting domain-containing protein [Pelomonas sp. KK5]|uniref:PEP-CTERM sorting domain-containing protein n=1 Tax=Pelomonas sp. KK5 TaxID=1855730 RepID=UPI00097BAF57|nr:PEP-CTERM sorting domain-containing protein [Pelomonas sp. KK5]
MSTRHYGRLLAAALLLLAMSGTARAELTALEQAIRAAQAAQDAANGSGDAARAARAALKSSAAAAGSAQQTANANGDSDSAAQSAADAEKSSAKAADASRSAERHAKAAQDAAQRGDAAKAGAEADAAQKDAAAAHGAADAAGKSADAGADSADSAQRKAQLDSQLPGGGPPPSDDQQKKYKQQISDANYDIQNVEDPAEQEAKKRQKRMKSIQSAEEAEDDAAKDKAAQLKPPDTPVGVDFHITSFFDVFFQLQPLPSQFPTPAAPSSVPELKPAQGDKGRVYLHLVNDNPFDVILTGVRASFFGDAVTGFDPFSGSQTVGANATATVLIGLLDFDGPGDSFTAAEFSFDTSLDQAGLGPDVMLDVSIAAPEPGSLALVMLGLACACGSRRTARARRCPAAPGSRAPARR